MSDKHHRTADTASEDGRVDQGQHDPDGQSADHDRPRPSLPRARSIERQERLRERAQAAPRRAVRSFVQLPKKVNPMVLIAAAIVVIFLAVSIAQPLRNYFEQRAELAQINSQIAQQERERDRLTEELNRYDNEDYIREQARTRLGLIEPGESAFRIMSPEIHANAPGSTPSADEEVAERGEWYQQLWDAISIPEEEALPSEDNPIDHKLPTVPNSDADNHDGNNSSGGQGAAGGAPTGDSN